MNLLEKKILVQVVIIKNIILTFVNVGEKKKKGQNYVNFVKKILTYWKKNVMSAYWKKI